MKQNSQNMISVPGNKTIMYLKGSFFFAFLSSTFLYILVRILFYEFPFTVAEGFELYIKMLVVIWTFFVAGKLAIAGIEIIENNSDKIKSGRLLLMPALKKAMFILLTATLAYAGKTTFNSSDIADAANNSSDESTMDGVSH